MQEVDNAIMALKPNKAPGPDDIMAEFYKLFKEVLSKKLHAVLTTCLQEEKIPLSWLGEGEERLFLFPSLIRI